MATEPVENELDCVLEDVWIEVLLPLLSIRDIFQLCAVNRRIRDLLLNECTFRRLCQQRYQLSPSLNSSYISAAKTLYISMSVVSVDTNLLWDICWFSPRDFCCEGLLSSTSRFHIHLHRSQLLVQLSSLALTLHETSGHAIHWNKAGLLLHHQELTARNVNALLPAEMKSVSGGTLENVTKLLHKRFDSHERYQQALLDRLEQDVQKLLPHLPMAYRYSRLIELAHCFHSAVARDPTMYSTIVRDTSYGTVIPQPLRTCTWTHHQDLHWKSVYEFRSTPEIDIHVLGTRNWISVAAQLSHDHSVMKLLITGDLRTSQMNDYFEAVTEYNSIWKDLPVSTRYSRAVMHNELGAFLLSSTSASDSRKEYTKMELVNAMVMFGKNLADEATSKSDQTDHHVTANKGNPPRRSKTRARGGRE
eukprot:scpid49739/ scgid31731/ 